MISKIECNVIALCYCEMYTLYVYYRLIKVLFRRYHFRTINNFHDRARSVLNSNEAKLLVDFDQ